MINLIVELAVIHAVLMLAYMVVLRNANLYRYRRCYLILSTIFAVVVPLLKLPVLIAPQIQITSQESFTSSIVNETEQIVTSTFGFGPFGNSSISVYRPGCGCEVAGDFSINEIKLHSNLK